VQLLLASLLLAASPPAPAPAKLGLCEACHGRNGRARTPDAPHLGGQNPAYLVQALQQYRDGRRQASVMNGIAGTLSPADIEALARWYAAQPWSNAEP
jgi:cytochrome c553